MDGECRTLGEIEDTGLWWRLHWSFAPISTTGLQVYAQMYPQIDRRGNSYHTKVLSKKSYGFDFNSVSRTYLKYSLNKINNISIIAYH